MLLLYLTIIDDEKDKTKFEYLYYEYKDRMMAMAMSVLHNNADAEDAVQNAFIAIAKNMKSLGDVDSKESLSYVLKATKNHAINVLNKREKRKEISIEIIDDITDEDFVEKLEITNQYDIVVNSIIALDEIYRDVLFYHFVKGMTAKEISLLLERKQSTVKQQLVRGKKLLLELLGDDTNNK